MAADLFFFFFPRHLFRLSFFLFLFLFFLNPAMRAQEPCEGRGGRPGLPVPNSPYGLCGRKATLT